MRTQPAPHSPGFVRKLARQLLVALVGLAAAAALGQNRIERDGVVLHWGLATPVSQAEQMAFQQMYGGRPVGGGKLNHLVLALYDFKTGKRIDNAIVRAQLREPGIVDGPAKYLPPLVVNNEVSYGQLFGTAERPPYRFKVTVKLPDRQRAIEYAIAVSPMRASDL